MNRFFSAFRSQFLQEHKIRKYLLYAVGEIILVVIGILIALQINNWNLAIVHKQDQIDNLENFYLSFNENMQIEPMIKMIEYARMGEERWIDYLTHTKPYTDSLLDYGYLIGVTAYISPNMGFYESLKLKGLETINDKDLRNRLSIVFEQNYPQIKNTMDFFNMRFSEERINFFNKYFKLSSNAKMRVTSNVHYSFDHAMYTIDGLKDKEKMEKDSDFLEFVIASKLFHDQLLIFLNRVLSNIYKAQNRIYTELNYLKFGTPQQREIKMELKGYQEAREVFVSGEFNNWRAVDYGKMLRTPDGWERKFDLFPGIYEYKFIINGEQWMMDPSNPDSIYVPEVDSYNSILTVEE